MIKRLRRWSEASAALHDGAWPGIPVDRLSSLTLPCRGRLPGSS
jgi:hypothetical protein